VRIAGLVSLLGLTLVTMSCQAFIDADIRPKGIGAQCTDSAECQASYCERGICTANCDSDQQCPAPTRCFAAKCAKPLKVAALWVGVIAGGEGWTLTHQEGMVETAQRLPYLDWYYRENVLPYSGDVARAVDEAAEQGVDVVVANSFSHRDEILEKAEQYPHIKFMTCASYKSNGKNANSFTSHEEQAWWVAGRAAGSKLGPKKRLGYVGSFITPEVVRHITAFYLGARSIEPEATLEVQWLGFWYDYKTPQAYTYKGPLTEDVEVRVFREELLTYRLLEAGAEVIGHHADNQRPVRLVERLTKEGKISNRFSLSNDNPNAYRELTADQLPNGPPLQTCIGSPYWYWTPLYTDLFDQVQRGVWDPNVNRNDPMTQDPATSPVGFNLNPTIGIDDSAVRSWVNEIAQKGWEYTFDGPYETTGQRDADGDGVYDPVQRFEASEKMSEAEYQRMCWFPKGIVEKAVLTDPSSADIPALVPDANRIANDAAFLADIEGPPGAPPGVGLNCNENL
jgi:basic membrane lipoprotein Med (substrate-binding protein (PBP1-ABC) superfamily)